uniref:Uncharacterized protein n=1 Tax=Chenopodium quinoa TaxID=63459 RepID=A0A803LR36_CHEQI
MTLFSGSQSLKHFKDKEARDMIHEGTPTMVGCTVPNKDKNIALFDDGKLGIPQFGYLMSLRSSYILVRSGYKFFIEPYNPHRFGRQFGFCQDVPGMLTRVVDDRQSDDQDFESVVADFLEVEAILHVPRPTAGKGKGIRIATNNFRDNSPSLPRKEIQSPTQSLKLVDGPHSVELASKAFEVRQSVDEDRTAAI